MNKPDILQKYHLSPDDLLGRGIEAEVYAYGPDTVLKLYEGTASLEHLTLLKQFYDLLPRQFIPYRLPRIHTITAEYPFLITVEERLPGTLMSTILPTLTPPQLEQMMGRYLTAALALSRLSAPPDFDRYKLFDPEGLSQRSAGDWHQFLARYLNWKLTEVTSYLARNVRDLAAKVAQLQAILAQPYTGDHCLIHGDFFPDNLLMDDNWQVTGLLDFGLFTMYGDPLFDLATGWVFFDMYDELRVNLRQRYLNFILGRFGLTVRGKLYRYVLLYSILSANAYSPQCADGHYRWCVDNLNREEYWRDIE